MSEPERRYNYKQLNQEQSKVFLMAIMLQGKQVDISKDLENIFTIQVIKKRIEVLKLPIQFTDYAYMASLALCEVVGHSVVLLIDCLNKYEGQTVDVEKLTALYPMGFYTQESFEDYLDNVIKPKKIKWAEVY